VTVEPTEVAPAEVPGEGDELIKLVGYSDEEKVLVKVNDKYVPGIIFGNQIVDPNSDDEVNIIINDTPTTTPSSTIIKPDKNFTKNTNYKIGDVVTYDNKKGEIVDVQNDSVDLDTYTIS